MWWIGRKGIRKEADTPGGALLIDKCDYTSSDITARTFKICGTAWSREMRFKGLVTSRIGRLDIYYVRKSPTLLPKVLARTQDAGINSPAQSQDHIKPQSHRDPTPKDFPNPNRLNPHSNTSNPQSLFQRAPTRSQIHIPTSTPPPPPPLEG